MAAKRKRKTQSSLQWLAIPIALAIAAGAGFALLYRSAPATAPTRAEAGGRVSAGAHDRDEIGDASREKLREILRDAETADRENFEHDSAPRVSR